MFTIAIITVARQPNTLDRCLDSILCQLDGNVDVHLWIGSDDASHTQRFESYVHIHPMKTQQWHSIRDWSVHRRFCVNYQRALSTLQMTPAQGLCVCEDDIVVRAGFAEQLKLTIDEIESSAGMTDYALAAYAAYDFESDRSLYRGRYYCSYPADKFFGTQCVYFPSSIVFDVQLRMQRDGVELSRAPGDLVLREYFIEQQNLYACTRSLAQHKGRTSTGLGDFHESPTFERRFEPIEGFSTAQ